MLGEGTMLINGTHEYIDQWVYMTEDKVENYTW